MKKMIRDRSIFVVVACIALAASVLLTAVRVTPVHLAEDVRAMVSPEAEVAFTTFFEGIQTWYQETPAGEEGVTISQQGNYARLMDTIMTLEPFITDCETAAMSDADSTARLVEYNGPLTSLLVVVLNLSMVVNAEGSYTFPVDEWAAMGSLLEEVVGAYQA